MLMKAQSGTLTGVPLFFCCNGGLCTLPNPRQTRRFSRLYQRQRRVFGVLREKWQVETVKAERRGRRVREEGKKNPPQTWVCRGKGLTLLFRCGGHGVNERRNFLTEQGDNRPGKHAAQPGDDQ